MQSGKCQLSRAAFLSRMCSSASTSTEFDTGKACGQCRFPVEKVPGGAKIHH